MPATMILTSTAKTWVMTVYTTWRALTVGTADYEEGTAWGFPAKKLRQLVQNKRTRRVFREVLLVRIITLRRIEIME